MSSHLIECSAKTAVSAVIEKARALGNANHFGQRRPEYMVPLFRRHNATDLAQTSATSVSRILRYCHDSLFVISGDPTAISESGLCIRFKNPKTM
jgi:hypothetical protein